VTIKRGSATVIGFWSWHLKSAYQHEGEKGCRLSFRDHVWLRTTASVDEILDATGAAMKIYSAIRKQDSTDKEINVLDALGQGQARIDRAIRSDFDFNSERGEL